MPDVWEFGTPSDDEHRYSDGTITPSRRQVVLLNGVAVGEVEIHTHKRKGPDGLTDLSYGFTAITYGPLPGGK